MPRGFTLIEISVVITILGLMTALAIPKLTATHERIHVDLATGRLHAVWCAQRYYWLEHGAYAESLKDLKTVGLLDAGFAARDDDFDYRIDGDGAGFLATAERTATGWRGSLTIDENGIVAGFVENGAGRRVLP